MKRIVCIMLLVVMTISCKKNFLDITPDGRLTLNDVFTDELRVEAYLNTTYASIPTYFATYNLYTFLAPMTDEANESQTGNGAGYVAERWMIGYLTPSADPLSAQGASAANMDHYVSFWTGIRNANVFLENIDHAIVDPINRSRFTAEAHVLRAFYYWELIKKYGPMPIVEKPFESGFDYKSLKRPTFQDCVDFIVNECDSAIASPDLPIRITVPTESGRFSKAVAYIIKSEALLYNASPLWNANGDNAKWGKAAAASKDALEKLTAGNEYMLATDYESYFLNQADLVPSPRDKETIYERPNGLSSTARSWNCIPSKTGSVRAGTCPSQELVDSYDMQATGEPAITGYSDADHIMPIINPGSGYDETAPYAGRDPRFYATVWYNNANYDNISGSGVLYPLQIYKGGNDQLLKVPPSLKNTHTGYYLRKFIDSRLNNTIAQTAGWKKYRLAEIYLNYAEAENEASGPIAEVYAAINKIRSRASMPDLPAGLSQEQMRERIRRERRVELAIEEHRFWDVRRWKILSQTDKLVTGMEITKNPDNSFTYNRFVAERREFGWQDKYMVFPIPISDISLIPDFTTNQNPGW